MTETTYYGVCFGGPWAGKQWTHHHPILTVVRRRQGPEAVTAAMSTDASVEVEYGHYKHSEERAEWDWKGWAL